MVENIKYCHITEKENTSFIFNHVRVTWDKQIRLHRQAETPRRCSYYSYM
ncbi:MAG TPA: hypothetical protein VIK89_15500 [Cytophagaceae bacterium]